MLVLCLFWFLVCLFCFLIFDTDGNYNNGTHTSVYFTKTILGCHVTRRIQVTKDGSNPPDSIICYHQFWSWHFEFVMTAYEWSLFSWFIVVSKRLRVSETAKMSCSQLWFNPHDTIVLPDCFADWRLHVLDMKIWKKFILLKLAGQFSSISSTTANLSRLEVIGLGENCAYLLCYIAWWPRFLISKQHFWLLLLKYLEYSKLNLTTKVRKIWLNF